MTNEPFPLLASPLTVGTMRLKNRILVPAHGGRAPGAMLETAEDADNYQAYYIESRARGGAAWLGGSTIFAADTTTRPPGWEGRWPSVSTYRHPSFERWYGRFVESAHAAGAVATTQLVMFSHNGPSETLAKPVVNAVNRELDRDEIQQMVREFAGCAGVAKRAGIDGVEIHANHADVLEWFLSPYTNRRADEYGGSVENRMRMLIEVIDAIREEVGRDYTVGVRLNMDECMADGYGFEVAAEMVRRLETTGQLDFLHFDVGSNWGNPSYIPTVHFAEAGWADMAGELKALTSVPVVYSGRVTDPAAGEKILADGLADVVAFNRATIADPDLPRKAFAGRVEEIRPCIGVNDCINRVMQEGRPFSCAVNPRVSFPLEPDPAAADRVKRVLVVGGGPAGMAAAVGAAERGHQVTLWERDERLGGQLNIAAMAPMHEPFTKLVRWYDDRLERLKVDVRFGQAATRRDVLEFGADAVVVATGATARRPDIPGVDLPHVLEHRDVLNGTVTAGRTVLIVAEDDYMPPVSVADLLGGEGREITLVYATPRPAEGIGAYSIGGLLGRLFEHDVTIRLSESVCRIEADAVEVRNVYTNRTERLGGFESVVLACGGSAENGLHRELKGTLGELYEIGDAFNPRRLASATREGWAAGREI